MYIEVDAEKYWDLVEERDRFKKLVTKLEKENKELRHNLHGQKRAAVKYSDEVKELKVVIKMGCGKGKKKK